MPAWMEGKAILGDTFPERTHVFAARDRCGDAHNRIRAIIGMDSMLVHNFYPELARLNWSSYKEDAYPGMPLLRILSTSVSMKNRLDEFQTRWLTSTRPEFEFYDLKQDPLGIHDTATDKANREAVTAMRTAMDDWIKLTGDRGAFPDPPTEPSLAEIQKSKREDYNRTWTKRLSKPEPTDEERLSWWEKSYGLPSSTEKSK